MQRPFESLVKIHSFPTNGFFRFILILLFTFSVLTVLAEVSINRERPLDLGWRFYKGDAYYSAEYNEYDDSTWRLVDLPHDWSIEDLPGQDGKTVIGPFSKQSPGEIATGNTMGGTAWYRKNFTLDSNDVNKIVYLNFDGVYMESEVWINAQRVGFHANGYMPFYYDISPYLRPAGESNLISVRVHNLGANSRWYTGSGIYRHVWLTVVNPVHVEVWGTFITTPEVSKTESLVNVNLSLNNREKEESAVEVLTTVFDARGKEVAKSSEDVLIEANRQKLLDQQFRIKNPKLWSLDSPVLYHAETILKQSGKIIDRYTTTFGIRSIEFSPDKGFFLNGKSVLLKGSCIHHDNGLLGSATFDRAEERRVELMKANGFNAIRTAHNPPSKQFLDACDRIGILVMDEAFDTWEEAKRPHGVHRFFRHCWQDELTAFLKRDRNHPSVIIWSIGNEIRERATPRGLKIGKDLAEFVRKMDSTRPVTNAICDFWDARGKTWENTAPAFGILDVHGYNYQWRRYEEDHRLYPERIIIGTESIAREALQNWRLVEKHPYVIGDFVWTGMDHFGESGLAYSLYIDPDTSLTHCRPWPWFNSWCGDIDLIGDKKPQSLYRDVVWGRSDLEVLVHSPVPEDKKELVSFWGWADEVPSWNWGEALYEPLQVSVYSNCPEVRLELNGKEVGRQHIDTDTSITARFFVPYEQGELKATAYRNGKKVAKRVLKTTGIAKKINLTAEQKEIKADRNDLAYVTVEITDQKGRRVPDADQGLGIIVEGEGQLLAAGSGVPNVMTSFQQAQCSTFRGRALIIVRPTGEAGEIRVTAEGSGLDRHTVRIKVNLNNSQLQY